MVPKSASVGEFGPLAGCGSLRERTKTRVSAACVWKCALRLSVRVINPIERGQEVGRVHV